MIKVRHAKARSGYRVAVTFSDGTEGVADFSKLVKRQPFLALRDEKLFRKLRVEHGAIEWSRAEVGIASEAVYALAHGLKAPKTIEHARANELAMSLRELRKIVGKTQVEAAKRAKLTQGALSQFESSSDHKLSALRRYVAALGGQLEVLAVIGTRRFPLHGV